MTELQPGMQVRTAAVLSAQDWSPEQNKLRQEGADGTIKAVYTLGDAEPWYEVAHGPATTAKYSAHELTPIRERATEAAAPTPEQTRLDKVEQRLTAVETEQERYVATIAAELVRLEIRAQRIERAGIEERRPHPSEPDPRADIDAVQEWCELPAHDTLPLLGELRQSPQTRRRAAAAVLEAAPALLRRIEQLEQDLSTWEETLDPPEQSPRHRRIQAWQALERVIRRWFDGLADLHISTLTKSEMGVRKALQVLDELPDDEPDSERACRAAGCPLCTCERDGLGLLEHVDPNCPAGCRVGLAQPMQDKPA